MIGSKFKNRKNGYIYELSRIDDANGIAWFSDDSSMSLIRLMDNAYFEKINENMNNNYGDDVPIDPAEFFAQSNNVWSQVATAAIAGRNLNNTGDLGSHETRIDKNTGKVIQKEMSIRDYEREVGDLQNTTISKSAEEELLEKYKDFGKPVKPAFHHIDEPEEKMNVVHVHRDIVEPMVLQQPILQPILQATPIQQPVDVFAKVKRNTPFKASFEVEGLIPSIALLREWEENTDESILGRISEEFANSLLSNPALLAEKIKEQLEKKVFKNKK